MAIAMSLGNRFRNTKACRRVDTSKAATMSIERTVSTMDKAFVIQFVTSFEYLIVAMAIAVIGKVYAHHDIENLNPRKKLIRTTCFKHV